MQNYTALPSKHVLPNIITVVIINIIHGGNVNCYMYQQINMFRPCLVLFTWHVSTASQITSIKMELWERL